MSEQWNDGTREVLIAEFEQLSSAFLQNEQLGDSRVNIFFIASAGLLAAIGLSEDVTVFIKEKEAQYAGIFALLLMLIYGWFTLTRLVHRNLVSDSYLRKLGRLRYAFLMQYPQLRDWLPFPAKRDRLNRGLAWSDFVVPAKAGLLEFICLVNALVAGGLVAMLLLLSSSATWWAFALASVNGVLAVLFLEFYFVRQRYKNGLPAEGEHDPLPKPPNIPKPPNKTVSLV
jgi:hypothetical protein